jgi:hypothetical protein
MFRALSSTTNPFVELFWTRIFIPHKLTINLVARLDAGKFLGTRFGSLHDSSRRSLVNVVEVRDFSLGIRR